MLNEPLYRALAELYGDVRVTNEGDEGVIEETVKSTQKKSKGAAKEPPVYIARKARGGEQYAVNCPVCGDRRRRLYISHWAFRKSFVEKNGERYRLITSGLMFCQHEKCDLETVRSAVWGRLGGEPITLDQATKVQAAKRRKETPICLPEGAVPINSIDAPIACREYLEDRGFDLAELYKLWDVHAVETLPEYPDHGPKIIYPVKSASKCLFWQARLAYNPTREQIKAGHRKYYITPGAWKAGCLYNQTLAVDTTTKAAKAGHQPVVVLVEGVTDVHKVGTCAVAFFGKVPSDMQLKLLIATTLHRSVGVLMLDGDAREEAQKLLDRYGGDKLFTGGLHPVWLDDKDPADHTREEIWEKIARSIDGA